MTSENDISDAGDDGSDGNSATPETVMAAMQVVQRAEKSGYDVYVLYKSAKMQQRGKTKASSFFKKQAKHPQVQTSEERTRELERAKATSTCRACGEVGHWAKDPVCPKHQAKDAKKKEVLVPSSRSLTAGDCKLPLADSLVTQASCVSCHCPQAPGILDSGCQRTVMGLLVFQAWEAKLLELGIICNQVPRQNSTEVFQFGNNGQLQSLFIVTLPVSVFNAKQELEICVVAWLTPLLLSRHTISRLGLSIDFDQNTISSQKLGLRNCAISEVGGHLVLDLLADSLVCVGPG